jgi:hypothetical protein
VVAGVSSFDDPMNVMTSDNSLLLILRRLDEIERKLDDVDNIISVSLRSRASPAAADRV